MEGLGPYRQRSLAFGTSETVIVRRRRHQWWQQDRQQAHCFEVALQTEQMEMRRMENEISLENRRVCVSVCVCEIVSMCVCL